MTDPDVLADYTVEFFGPKGPYPIPEQQATYQQVGQRVPQAAPQARPEQQQVARPQMPVPPQPQGPEGTGEFWNSFGNVADRDPQNAWRYLNAQNPEVFRQKLLVME